MYHLDEFYETLLLAVALYIECLAIKLEHLEFHLQTFDLAFGLDGSPLVRDQLGLHFLAPWLILHYLHLLHQLLLDIVAISFTVLERHLTIAEHIQFCPESHILLLNHVQFLQVSTFLLS